MTMFWRERVTIPVLLVGALLVAVPVVAQTPDPARPSRLLDHVTFLPADASPPAAQARPMAFQYSDAYRLRARIHKYASVTMLPLFAAESVVGQSLYNHPTDGKRSAHLAIATGIGGLFAVNAVTGVWNLVEARKDPTGRGRRMLHGILMLAADAAFLGTSATGPSREGFEGGNRGGSQGGDGNRGLHRTLAFTSVSLASLGYVIMLLGGGK